MDGDGRERSCSGSNKRKRSAKVTLGQYQIYLEELQNNEMFRTNKFNPKQPDILEESWNVLTQKLNAAGGPIKTTHQWKERFADWKCNVRKKARKLELARIKTGGGPPEIPLTKIEEQLLDLTGRAVINGIEEIPELGFEANQTAPATTPDPVRPPHATPTEENITTPKEKNITITPTEKNITTPTSTQTERNSRGNSKYKRPTLAASVRNLVEQDTASTNYLQEISESLKTLVELKRKELLIAEIQLKLNHPNTDFEILDDIAE